MLRSFFVLISTVVLVASGIVLYERIQRDGVDKVLHSLSFRQSGQQAAASDLLAAAVVLEQSHEAKDTYARADLSRFKGLVLAYASDSNYCIQVAKAEKWYRLSGPGGSPASGSC